MLELFTNAHTNIFTLQPGHKFETFDLTLVDAVSLLSSIM